MKRLFVFVLLCCLLCGTVLADSENSISYVACGDGTMFVIMDDGKLIAWGDNNGGFIPLEHRALNISYNDRRLIMCDVKDIAVGDKCVLAIKNSNELYGWGNDGIMSLLCGNAHGGLARQPVKLMDNVMCASSGFEHNAAITSDGVLYTWGRDTNGSLGLGESNHAIFKEPQKIMGNAVKVLCCSNDTLVLADDNKLYAWGESFGYTIPRMVALGITDIAKASSGAYLVLNKSDEVKLLSCVTEKDDKVTTTKVKLSPVISSNVSSITDYGYTRNDGTLWMCAERGSNCFVPLAKDIQHISCSDMNYRAYDTHNTLIVEKNEYNSFVFSESHHDSDVNVDIQANGSGIIWAIIIAALIAAAAIVVADEPEFYKKLKSRLSKYF